MTEPAAIAASQSESALGDLLAQTALGNRAAFGTLYRSTASRLFGICLRVMVDRSEAEDVLQEVFATVWSKAGQFDRERASAMAWLAMIARNKAIDRLRALPPRQAQSLADWEPASEDPSPSQLAGAAADRVRLDDCLGQLEARPRSLIRAAFFDGCTYAELAARIGAPLGSVKSWIRRALLQLRACLGP